MSLIEAGSRIMMKTVALAATAVLTLGIGPGLGKSAQSSQGTWFVEIPGQYAHPPKYAGPAPVTKTDHGTWFVEMPGQYAHPPKYTGPVPVTEADRGTWYVEQPGVFAHPAF